MKPVDLHINFYVLDEKRRQAGLKMCEAAERLDISAPTLSRIRAGLSVSYRTLTKLAKALDVNPRDLVLRGSDGL